MCHSGKRYLWLDGSEERSTVGPKVRPAEISQLFHLETRPLRTEVTPTDGIDHAHCRQPIFLYKITYLITNLFIYL